LRSCGVGEEGIRALAGSEAFSGLEGLVLSNGDLRDATLEHLTATSTVTGLCSLDLSSNPFGRTGMAALARAPSGGLPELALAWCQLDDEAAPALANCPVLANLHKLDLSHNRIGAGGASALARSEHLRGVIDLDLQSNAIPAAGARAFAEAAGLGSLR